MSCIEAIIFDCDGVLFESREANLAYYNQILAQFDAPAVTGDQTCKAHLCHTASSPVVLAELLPAVDLQPALEYAMSLDYCQFIPFMQPEPNLQPVLEQLSLRFPLAVATNRGASVEAILAHFGLAEFFSTVVTCRDVAAPKPAPDMLLLAAERLKLLPELCLFIGDSELDQQAAAGAGVQFAGYGGLASAGLELDNHLQLLDFLIPAS